MRLVPGLTNGLNLDFRDLAAWLQAHGRQQLKFCSFYLHRLMPSLPCGRQCINQSMVRILSALGRSKSSP